MRCPVARKLIPLKRQIEGYSGKKNKRYGRCRRAWSGLIADKEHCFSNRCSGDLPIPGCLRSWRQRRIATAATPSNGSVMTNSLAGGWMTRTVMAIAASSHISPVNVGSTPALRQVLFHISGQIFRGRAAPLRTGSNVDCSRCNQDCDGLHDMIQKKNGDIGTFNLTSPQVNPRIHQRTISGSPSLVGEEQILATRFRIQIRPDTRRCRRSAWTSHEGSVTPHR